MERFVHVSVESLMDVQEKVLDLMKNVESSSFYIDPLLQFLRPVLYLLSSRA